MKTNENNLPTHWKLRIYVRGTGIIHACSLTEPVVTKEITGQISDVTFTPLDSPEHSDRIGFIDWKDVAAISWRLEPKEEPMRIVPLEPRKKSKSGLFQTKRYAV